MLRRFALAALVLAATPAMAQNQFPDPNLHVPGDMSFSGYPTARHSLPAIVWDNAGGTSAYNPIGTVSADLLSAWGVSEVRYMSVNVADYVQGSMKCKFRNGAYADLNVTGNGQTTPVAITAGTGSQQLICLPTVGGTTFRIQQSGSAPAISIVP